jgi:hypothetical protein
MISLSFLFWLLVILFGIVGAMRGWAKEILVIFSVILALFVITVLETYVPYVSGAINSASPNAHFWVRAIIVIGMAFFGYQSPSFPPLEGKTRGERVQDRLLGFLLGMINGYLIFGTLWWYLHSANYPFEQITPPRQDDVNALALLNNMAPAKLVAPGIYIAVAVSFVFVLIVFI